MSKIGVKTFYKNDPYFSIVGTSIGEVKGVERYKEGGSNTFLNCRKLSEIHGPLNRRVKVFIFTHKNKRQHTQERCTKGSVPFFENSFKGLIT